MTVTRREYKKLWARGNKDKVHYVAEKEGEKRTFENTVQLEKFLGYSARTIQRHINSGKDICGWKIARHRWFKEAK